MSRRALVLVFFLSLGASFLSFACSETAGSPSADGDLDMESALESDTTDADTLDGEALEETLTDGDRIESDVIDGDNAEGTEADRDDSEADLPPVPFTFAVISDTHLSTVNDSQNNRNFIAAGAHFTQLDPEVSFVVSTGDNIEDLLCIPDFTCENPVQVLANYRELIETYYPMPFHIVLGNHDDRYFDSFLDTETPWNQWVYVFGDTDFIPAPYYSFDYSGFQFIVMNATELATNHDDNDLPTFSQAQLDWLDGLLSRGLPSVIFWHHDLFPPSENAESDIPVLQIIGNHADTVKGVFMGHGHTFKRMEWKGVWFFETESLGRNEKLYYHWVECDPSLGSLRILNELEIEYQN
jgi:hypothetical protein